MVQFNVRKFTGKTGSRSVCGYFVEFSKRPRKRFVRLNPSQFADLKIYTTMHEIWKILKHTHKVNCIDMHSK